MSEDQIRGWVRRGELALVRPRVYGLGYAITSRDAENWEALLYAGPGACLTAGSGAHARGLINWPPRAEVIVATPRRCRSLPGITVLRQRHYDQGRVLLPDGLPVAPTVELMLDLAARDAFNVIRRALASLEFRHELDVRALLSACVKGRPGARQLRRALAKRLPGLARCKSELEVDFLLLVEACRLALPLVNWRVHGFEVDMYWPDLGLVIELDGEGNHHSGTQKRDDAARQAVLESHGLRVIRLDWADVHARRAATRDLLSAHGVPRV